MAKAVKKAPKTPSMLDEGFSKEPLLGRLETGHGNPDIPNYQPDPALYIP